MEKLVEAIDDEAAETPNGGISERFDNDFGTDASGVAESDADDRLAVLWLRVWFVRGILNHMCMLSRTLGICSI